MIDYNMLDYVLDLFMKFLLLEIVPDNKVSSQQEYQSPMLNIKETERILYTKRNLLEVMSEVMKLMTPEINIR
jgi:hypothetical protein